MPPAHLPLPPASPWCRAPRSTECRILRDNRPRTSIFARAGPPRAQAARPGAPVVTRLVRARRPDYFVLACAVTSRRPSVRGTCSRRRYASSPLARDAHPVRFPSWRAYASPLRDPSSRRRRAVRVCDRDAMLVGTSAPRGSSPTVGERPACALSAVSTSVRPVHIRDQLSARIGDEAALALSHASIVEIAARSGSTGLERRYGLRET
jgi:hypothetical protein